MRGSATIAVGVLYIRIVLLAAPGTQTCDGQKRTIGRVTVFVLKNGAVLASTALNINIDGSGRAYNWDNRLGLIHLCNAGEVYPAAGAPYHGSETSSTCTGRFMTDLKRIRAASWMNTTVGVIRWYGVAATGAVTIHGRSVTGVVPIEAEAGGGFLVSPTTLEDPHFGPRDQRRYVDPLTVASAVIPSDRSLAKLGVEPGTLASLGGQTVT